MMSLLSDYLEKVLTSQKPLIKALGEIIQKAAPSLQTSMKWGNITYHNEQNICAFFSHTNHLNLQFFLGTSLEDPKNLLEGTGKTMRHIKIRRASDINAEYISNLVQQSVQAT